MAARWPVGGIRTFYRYVYSQPVFADCDISLVAPGDDLAGDLGRYLSPEKFRVITTPESGRALGIAVHAELRKGNYDLLHSHGLTASVLCQIARVGRSVPHLMTMHDVFLPSMFDGVGGALKRQVLNVVLRKVDGVHAVSDDCASNFLEYVPAVSGDRVHAISHGIDTSRFHNADPVDIRRVHDLPAETALVGFFGRFMAQKGFRTLVDAVGLLKEAGFERPIKVITFGWGGFIREDFAYIRERDLEECFAQQAHTDEPERWMKGVDVVAMPSRWEACGLVGMEALTAGVPIVGSTCIGLREVLAGSPSRMVRPGDSHALADALRAELETPRREEFARYSTYAEKQFSVENCARSLRALCERVWRPEQARVA